MSASPLIVFAVDHRSACGWDLPLTRLGTGFGCGAELRDSDGENILQYNELLSEGTEMWWAHKNIRRFTGCEFVGFCSYRRFFSDLAPNMGVFPIHDARRGITPGYARHILSQDALYGIIRENGADGIAPLPFPDYAYCSGCLDVRDLMFRESEHHDMRLGMPRSLCDKAFDILLSNTPDWLKRHMESSFSCANTYHFNMFVLSLDDFIEYSDIIWKSSFECIRYAEESCVGSMLHRRWAAYLLERYTSCFMIALQLSSRKFVHLPILMFEKEKFT